MDDLANFSTAGIKEIVYENTYITDVNQYGSNAKFERGKVQAVLKDVLENRIAKQRYDPVKGAQISKQLADDLREKVKALGYDRCVGLALKCRARGAHMCLLLLQWQSPPSIRALITECIRCRYKLIIQVTVGQKQGQAMRIVSRCLWDTTTDSFASEYYENESMYCVCQVYGLYYE